MKLLYITDEFGHIESHLLKGLFEDLNCPVQIDQRSLDDIVEKGIVRSGCSAIFLRDRLGRGRKFYDLCGKFIDVPVYLVSSVDLNNEVNSRGFAGFIKVPFTRAAIEPLLGCFLSAL